MNKLVKLVILGIAATGLIACKSTPQTTSERLKIKSDISIAYNEINGSTEQVFDLSKAKFSFINNKNVKLMYVDTDDNDLVIAQTWEKNEKKWGLKTIEKLASNSKVLTNYMKKNFFYRKNIRDGKQKFGTPKPKLVGSSSKKKSLSI